MTKPATTKAKSATTKAEPTNTKAKSAIPKPKSAIPKPKSATTKAKSAIKTGMKKSPSLRKKSQLDILLTRVIREPKIRYYTATLPPTCPDNMVLSDIMKYCVTLRVATHGRIVSFGLSGRDDQKVINKLLSKTYQGKTLKIKDTIAKYQPLKRKIIAPLSFNICPDSLKKHFGVEECLHFIRGKTSYFIMEFENMKAVEEAVVNPFEKFGRDFYLQAYSVHSVCKPTNDNPAKEI